MARKKTVFQGLSIGPDVELLLLVGAGAFALYYVWEKWGSSAVTGLTTDVSNAVSDVTGGGDDSGG